MGKLQVHKIRKKFASFQVLADISFVVSLGEIVGLIGPNGSGKTTLLECLTGLLAIESGTVEWNGKLLTPKKRNEVLWYQPDAVMPFVDQRVGTTLSFFQKTHGAGEDDLQKLIQNLDLFSVTDKTMKTLSKGYRRRVLLAIALLSRQPLLLLDEPFDGFDLRQSLGVMALLREYRKQRGMLLSIHQLSEAEKICDRFLLLDNGVVRGFGSLDELRGQAACDAEAGLEEVFLALT